jgi:threonine dehydrogenase-like Zn-dependent dehydrogenase
VIGIDCVPERLNIARNVLRIDTINFKEDDVLKRINELLQGGDLDVGIECAGFDYAHSWIHKAEMALGKCGNVLNLKTKISPGLETDTAEILSQMFSAVRPFGNVSIIGVYCGYANHFPIGVMMEKDLIVKCGQCPVQKYWKFCLEKIESGEMDPTFVITERASLADAPNLYHKFNEKEGGCVKVFLRPEPFH